MSERASAWRTALCALALASSCAPSRAACDWAAAKRDILRVLDVDAEQGAQFRKAAQDGWDTIEAIGKIVDAAARERIGQCRYEAAEFLTQRGFPPQH